jgi:hypothetical protein
MKLVTRHGTFRPVFSCNECTYIDENMFECCPRCGSTDINRIIARPVYERAENLSIEQEVLIEWEKSKATKQSLV